MKVVLPKKLPRNELVDLNVYLFSDPIPLPARGKVIWSDDKQKFELKKSSKPKANAEPDYWVGIQFINIDNFTQERIVRLVEKEFVSAEKTKNNQT